MLLQPPCLPLTQYNASDQNEDVYRPRPVQEGQVVGGKSVVKVEGISMDTYRVTLQAPGNNLSVVTMKAEPILILIDIPVMASLKTSTPTKEWWGKGQAYARYLAEFEKIKGRGYFEGRDEALAWCVEYFNKWKPECDATGAFIGPPPGVPPMDGSMRLRLPPPQEEDPGAEGKQQAEVAAAPVADTVADANHPKQQLEAAATNQEEKEAARASLSPIPKNSFLLVVFEVEEGSDVEQNVKAANMSGVPMCVAKLRGEPPTVSVCVGCFSFPVSFPDDHI